VFSTLEYGIHSGDIEDAELAAMWEQMEVLYAQLRPLIAAMDSELRKMRTSS